MVDFESSEQPTAAYIRKMRTYVPLLEALQAYLDQGWQAEILLWVVSVCGLLDSETIRIVWTYVLSFKAFKSTSWASRPFSLSLPGLS